MRILKKNNEKIGEEMLKKMRWDFVNSTELSLLRDLDNISSAYVPDLLYFNEARVILETWAKSLFTNSCSKLSLFYSDVAHIFRAQNTSFYEKIEAYTSAYITIRDAKNLAQTLLLPRPEKVEEIIFAIKRLSPEEYAEILQFLGQKKIKIVTEDIDDNA